MRMRGPLLYRGFRTTVTVYRQNGSWQTGDWVAGAPTTIALQAVVSVPDSADLDQVPEGDQETGWISIVTAQPLILTESAQTSDQIEYNGTLYRVARLWDLSAYGFYKALAAKMDPATEA